MSKRPTVWVKNLHAKTPTYHLWPFGPGADDTKTYCGRLVWAQSEDDMRGTFLRRDHAELIGKPCSKCFEEAGR